MTRKNSLFACVVILVLAVVCWPARLAGVVSSLPVTNSNDASACASPDDTSFHTHDHNGAELREREEETIRKTFSMNAAGARGSLEIDNVYGSIEVAGGPSNQVQLVVHRITRAESKDKLEDARKKVTLDITQEGDALRLYVNGPFRCRCQCEDCSGFRDEPGYIVTMDFELQIPRDMDIKLKTVNSRHIRVRNVTGSYVVRNVNGAIEMQDIAGSGNARTVNGPVQVAFRENPRANSEFATINGNVELRFQQNLSADFRFKTFNGGVYSDFVVTSLPVGAVQEERRGGKVIFRTDRFSGGRVGSGGPEIKLENLNGDIRILENHE
jgi:hypothetical protein